MSNLSRRTLVSSAAALPALSVPAVAISADPIFAKIDRCKTAWAEYSAECHREPETNFASPEHDAWERAQEAASDRWSAAFDDMIATPPTTRQGAAVLIDHVIETEQDEGDEVSIPLLKTLRAYLRLAS